MRDSLNTAIKEAMRAGDKARLSTLRMISAAFKDRDIAARVDAQGTATGKDSAGDDDLLQTLQKMVKQRREAIATYEQAGRAELADKEKVEIAVIEEFLPQQMDDAGIEQAVGDAIAETGAAGVKDMGRVMGLLKSKYAGQMDFGKASAAVKSKLAG